MIKYLILAFILFLSINSKAQDSKELYQRAKTSYENGEINQCLQFLKNCQQSLGGSNAKIESLKCQALVIKSDWINAAIAYKNYERLIPSSSKNGEAYSIMLDFKKEIWNELENIEKKRKEDKENEINEDLVLAKEEEKSQYTSNKTKIDKINKTNEEALYNESMQSKDLELLGIYKQEIKDSGKKIDIISTEIEKYKNPTSFLLQVLKDDDIIDFKYLLSIGADLKWVNPKGESLLHLAIDHNAKKIFEELMILNADVEQRDNEGNTPLIKAIINNKATFFSQLINNNASLTAVNLVTQQPPFYYSLINNNIKIGEILIKKGINPNDYFVIDNKNFTPLYLSVYQTKSIEYATFLIKNGAEIDKVSNDVQTPLMAAVDNKRLDFVNLLLNNGANVNFQDEFKQTVLHLAIRDENPEMILYLIQRGGANKKIKDSLGNSPYTLSKAINKDLSKLIRKNKSFIDLSTDYRNNNHERQYLAKVEKRIAEELHEKELRNVGFGAFRVGYVVPTDEIAKSNDIMPAYLSNGNPYFFSSEYQPFTSPFVTGKMGLKSGFSAGFTGIVHLEFINKKMPKFMGFGIPLDLNGAMMRYSWKPMSDGGDDFSFLYSEAKYGMWGVISLGAGLSLSFRPIYHLFIDFVVRPDFFLTAGGNYSSEGTRGVSNYSVSSSRYDNAIGIAYTYGVNFRYRQLFLSFELKKNVIDNQYFIEKVIYTEVGTNITGNYKVSTPGINLNYMQLSLGIVF